MAARIDLHGGAVHLRIHSGDANSLQYDIYLQDATEPYAASTSICRNQTECPATYLLSPNGAELDGEWLTWTIHVMDHADRKDRSVDVRIEIEQAGVVVPGGRWTAPPSLRLRQATTVIEQLDFEVSD